MKLLQFSAQRLLLVLLLVAASIVCLREYHRVTEMHPLVDARTYQKTRTLALIKSVSLALQMYINQSEGPLHLSKSTNGLADNVELVSVLTASSVSLPFSHFT